MFVACLGAVIGIAAASWLPGWGIVAGLIAVLAVLSWLTRSLEIVQRAMLIGVVLLGFSVGVGRYASVGPGANSVVKDVGRKVTIEGRVVVADRRDQGMGYTLDLLVIDDVPRNDRVLVSAPISSTAMIGDYLRATCALEQPEPFDGFAYDRFLAAKSIYATCRSLAASFIIEKDVLSWSDHFWRSIGSFHGWIDDRARAILPEPQATLLLGLLIGEDSFSDRWKEAFRATGTSHIVAASGYNVAIVAQLALIALVTLGLYRRQAYPLVLFAIGVFIIVAGAGAAVVRAGIMGVLALTARHVGRHTSPRNIIALTIVVLLLVEPRLLRDDVGFQLSVAATIGLIALTDRIASRLKMIPTTFGIRESLASTIAATIATVSIVLLSFGKLSIVAPLVNLLVLPFVPYAMALGAAAIALSSIGSSLGVWIALPVWTVLVTMTEIIATASRIPFASIMISPILGAGIVILSIVDILFLVRNLPKSYERDIDAWQWSRFCFVLCLMVGLFVLNIGVITWRSGRLNTESVHVFVFDVGQGDAAYIDGKEKDVIVDGGPTRTGLLENLSQVRYPWERHIDAVIATHPHADHVIGLIGLIGTYSVDEVVTSGVVHQEAGAEAFSSITSSPVIASATKQSWELSSEANLEILWPKNETDDLVSSNVHRRSIVLLLKVGEKSMLFTGDAEADVEKDLGDIGKIDVLKVGHHGSDTSTSQEFLNFINPDLAIISVGEGNSYGHPSPFVLARLSALGAEVLRTDQGGSIRVDFQNDDFSWWKLP